MDQNIILVVDDNHINRLFFESSFKKHGHQVSVAESGYQALALCESNTYQLILMDIRMDGMDGIQTAQKIKQLNTNQHTPIIAVSAERFDWQNHPSFTNSMLKPISQDDIAQLINHYIKECRIFNHEKALKISHNDESIVLKLRSMLLEQLPEDSAQIDVLYQRGEFDALGDLLHKMAGSARVCAADLLAEQLALLKGHLDDEQAREQYYQQLKSAVKQTIDSIQ